MSSHCRKAGILDYWLAAELLSAGRAPAVQRGRRDGRSCGPAFTVRAGTPLPWERGGPQSLFPLPQPARRFHVYCGIGSGKEMLGLLATRLGGELSLADESDSGASCLFSFSVDASGRPLCDTFHLSSLAWMSGLCRIPERSGNDWLAAYRTVSETQACDFTRRQNENAWAGRPLGYADLLVETRCIVSALGLSEPPGKLGIRIEECIGDCQHHRRMPDNPLTGELASVAHEVRNQDTGRGLRDYLASSGEVAQVGRIDVLASPLPLFQHLAPPLFPLGRWPTASDAALPAGQQFAINAAFKTLQYGAGLFAIDSAPDRGKAAVARDIVAVVLVERANRLAQLSLPAQAFIGERRWETAAGMSAVSIWQESLRGFEIIVTTADDDGAQSMLEAFAEASDENAPRKHPSANRPFPPIAARIDAGDFPRYFRPDTATAEGPTGSGGPFHSTAPAQLSEAWKQAVRRFRSAVHDEKRLREMRIKRFADFVTLGNLSQEMAARETRLVILAQRAAGARHGIEAALAAREIAAGDIAGAEARRLAHDARRPAPWATLRSFGKALRCWRSGSRTHALCLEHAAGRLAEMEIRLACRRRMLAAIERERAQESAALAEQQRKMAALKTALASAQAAMGDTSPAPAHWDDAARAAVQPAPWADPQWNAARARVFTAALHLHRTFVTANAARLASNLQVARAVLAGKAPDNAPPETIEAALASLFFVVPVLCLELTAFRDIFSGLRRESIGWLLLDDADQMPSPAVVGALWRARRAVLFGNGQASAPRSALPAGMRQALSRYYRLDGAWPEQAASAYSVAVRSGRLGCWRKTKEGELWVGVPLSGQGATRKRQRAATTRRRADRQTAAT